VVTDAAMTWVAIVAYGILVTTFASLATYIACVIWNRYSSHPPAPGKPS
jgi:hypothetical protein